MRNENFMINERFEKSLVKLFGDMNIPNNILGLGVLPKDMLDKSLGCNILVEERLQILLNKIQGYIMSMADESEEYGSEHETFRLQSEGIGLLLAYREIIKHFPESK